MSETTIRISGTDILQKSWHWFLSLRSFRIGRLGAQPQWEWTISIRKSGTSACAKKPQRQMQFEMLKNVCLFQRLFANWETSWLSYHVLHPSWERKSLLFHLLPSQHISLSLVGFFIFPLLFLSCSPLGGEMPPFLLSLSFAGAPEVTAVHHCPFPQWARKGSLAWLWTPCCSCVVYK